MLKLKDFLIVGNKISPNTEVLKVVKKPYGYLVTLYNSYVTITKIKITFNDLRYAKASWVVDMNYRPIERFTTYFDEEGNSISKKKYHDTRRQSKTSRGSL